jgi:GNAT superfamily N-acetyltransferase
VIVRPARTGDAEAISELLTALGYPASTEAIPERLSRLMATGWATALVAENEGEVLGLATGHVLPVLHHTGLIARLTTLVVAESARGRGVGKQLVEAIEVWGRERGCQRIAVTTALHRDGAHAFYERLGYKHTGRRYQKLL